MGNHEKAAALFDALAAAQPVPSTVYRDHHKQ